MAFTEGDLPTADELMDAPILVYMHPDGRNSVRVADHIPKELVVDWLRHIADHVEQEFPDRMPL